MPDNLELRQQPLPVSNYASAVARAVEWLGDRYLLAKPINAGTRPSGFRTREAALKTAQAEPLAGNFR
jgi:hypothetical protein